MRMMMRKLSLRMINRNSPLNGVKKVKLKMIKHSIILALMVFTMEGFSQVKNIDRVVATVGDRPILYSDIETQRYQLINGGQDLGPNARCLLLEQLLFQNLLLTQADIDSVEIGEGQINGELENRIKYFERLLGGRENLEREYGKSIVEIKDEFYEQIEDKLRAQTVQQGITKGIIVTPGQVKSYYNSLHKDSIPYVNAQVEMAHIIIKPKVDEAEKEKLKKELSDYRKLILDGTYKFGAIAGLISQDPETAKKGGEVGFVRRGMLVPEFDAAAFSLKEGEITEPFESQFGIHVMQLIERRGDEYNCRHILMVPKVSDSEKRKVISKLDSIVGMVKSGAMTFDEAASKYSEDDETKYNGGVVLNPQNGETKIPVNEMDAATFLMVDAMKIGEISKPAQYESPERETYFRIVKLNKRYAPHIASLDTDYDMVKKAAQYDTENKALEKWVQGKSKSTSVWIEDGFITCDYDYQWIPTK
jgi:peptidyl-prolyl cis-trans isomerase SurA